MDSTRRKVYTQIQHDIKQEFGVDMTIEQIHIMVLHQTLIMKEAMEIQANIMLPCFGKFVYNTKRAERQDSKCKIVLKENLLYDMMKKIKR